LHHKRPVPIKQQLLARAVGVALETRAEQQRDNGRAWTLLSPVC
jgi:hypothetical protein